MEHGIYYTYTYYKCRCDLCKEGAKEYRKSRRLEGPDDPRHGTVNGYNNYNCRCDSCALAVKRKRTKDKTFESRNDKLARKYGIDLVDFYRMIDDQDDKCAACGLPSQFATGDFHVDHDHDTGLVRGLLCRGCNLALGHVWDDPVRLRALADYLESHWRNNPEDYRSNLEYGAWKSTENIIGRGAVD